MLVDVFDIKTNKLAFTARFKDSTLRELEGNYVAYYPGGQKEQEGHFKNGKQQGEWITWDSLGVKTTETLFDKGILATSSELIYTNGKLTGKSIRDNNGVERSYVNYDKKGNEIKDDHVFVKVEKEPIFANGRISFQSYLIKQVDGAIPSRNGAPARYYLVYVNFIVEKNGEVTNVKHQSVEGYGMEAEAKRVVQLSPAWEPAMQNGHTVRYQMQVIVPFSVSR